MSTFADSSALVKLYADEEGAKEVRSLDAVAVSAIARVEVTAALWRKCRLGELSPAQASLLAAAFEADLLGTGEVVARFAVVALSAAILERAAALLATNSLRAYDAVQLASALAARDADPGLESFACFDHELRDAAAAAGLRPLPG